MQAIILAAGSCSRFWPLNTRHKSLMKLQGKTLLEHTIEGLQATDITDIIVVQGPDQDVETHITAPDTMDVQFVTQDSPDGMGDALEQAREHINDPFLVTGPYRFDIKMLFENMRSLDEGFAGAVVGAKTMYPERYGILGLSDDQQQATGIVEKPAAEQAPSAYKVVSTYLLTPEFFSYLNRVDSHEYQFEDALDLYMQEKRVGFTALDQEPPSLKYPWDLFAFNESLLDEQQPRIAESADIAESTVITGNVVIGENTKIYENAVIRGPCYIGPNCIIGNNAVVRSYSNIEAGSTVGTNMEIRGSIVQDGFSSHSGFIGDSIIGRHTAVGAGVITANRMVRGVDGDRPDVSVFVRAKDEQIDTGRNRLGMLVGDDVDIGTTANIMPGVCIGKCTFIGPATFVKQNIGEHKKYFTTMDGRELERR